MIPQKKCTICERRYTTQDTWKTNEEKMYCLTCFSMWNYMKQMVSTANVFATFKKMNVEFELVMRKLPIKSKK